MLAMFLSATFLASVSAKLHDPWQLRLTVRELVPSWPRPAAYGVATGVMMLELLIPALFIAGPRPLGLAGAAGTALLAAAFGGAFLLSRRLPYPVRCGCFGRLKATALSGWTLACSLVLLAGALAWTQAAGTVATFGSLPLRLAALVAVILVLLAHRVPRWSGAHL